MRFKPKFTRTALALFSSTFALILFFWKETRFTNQKQLPWQESYLNGKMEIIASTWEIESKGENHIELDNEIKTLPEDWLKPLQGKIEPYSPCPLRHDPGTFTSLFFRWVTIATELNITYYITSGTLLGAYRHSNPIPYDHDIDVIMDVNDVDKLIPLKDERGFDETSIDFHFLLQEDFSLSIEERKRLNCHGEHVPYYMDHCSFQEPYARLIQNDMYLDVYHFIKNNKTVTDPSDDGYVFNEKEIFPLRKCNFMEIETRCPQDTQAVLKRFYGDLNPVQKCVDGKWEDGNN